MVWWMIYARPKGIQIPFFKIKCTGGKPHVGPLKRASRFPHLNYVISGTSLVLTSLSYFKMSEWMSE